MLALPGPLMSSCDAGCQEPWDGLQCHLPVQSRYSLSSILYEYSLSLWRVFLRRSGEQKWWELEDKLQLCQEWEREYLKIPETKLETYNLFLVCLKIKTRVWLPWHRNGNACGSDELLLSSFGYSPRICMAYCESSFISLWAAVKLKRLWD